MGRKGLREAEAPAILKQADAIQPKLKADALGQYLGLTYVTRETLKITTIGRVNVSKQARKVLRRDRNLLAKERKRREQGAKPRAEYEANSIAAKARAEG
jgi:hypothetical protein